MPVFPSTIILCFAITLLLGAVHAGTWGTLPTHLPGLEKFVAEQQVRRDASAGRDAVP